jgi:hypothetical protein
LGTRTLKLVHVFSQDVCVNVQSWEARAAYFGQLRQRVAEIPGVVSAAISSQSTPPVNGWDEKCEIMGRPNIEPQDVRLNLISSEYFSLLHIPLLRGRIWDQAGTMRGARVAVINETMARQLWPNGDALGQAIRLPKVKSDPPLRLAALGSDEWFAVAGVVRDARDDGLANPIGRQSICLTQSGWVWIRTFWCAPVGRLFRCCMRFACR